MVITCAVCGYKYTAVVRGGKLFPREHKRVVEGKRYVAGTTKYVKEAGMKTCEGSYQSQEDPESYPIDHVEPYGPGGPSTE